MIPKFFNQYLIDSILAGHQKYVRDHPECFDAMFEKYGRPIGRFEQLAQKRPQLDPDETMSRDKP